MRALIQYLQGYLTKIRNAVNSPQLTATTFAKLPAASASNEGMYAAITDSTTNTWGATITGGGSLHVLAYCDGSVWSVAGK